MKAILFLRVLFIFAALLRAKAQTDEDTDCSKEDFRALSTDCCVKPFGLLFNPKMLSKVKKCKYNKKNSEWANYYKLNTLQQQYLYNFVDENATTTKKDLCTAGAFMECVFKEKGFLETDGSIAIAALTNYLLTLTNNDEFWNSTIDLTLTPMDRRWWESYSFSDIVENQFEKATCNKGVVVNLLPLMMVQMIQSEFIWMCPEQKNYTPDNNCLQRMKKYHFCDGKIYSPQARGVFYFPYV